MKIKNENVINYTIEQKKYKRNTIKSLISKKHVPLYSDFISKGALNFFKQKSIDKFYKFICKRIFSYISDDIVIISEFDKKKTVIKAACGDKESLKILKNILNNKLEITFIFPEESKNILTYNKLVRLKSSIFDITLHKLPKELCEKIEKKLKIKSIFIMPFAIESQILGTLTILSRSKKLPQNHFFIELISKFAAIELKRRKIEESFNENKEFFKAIFENAAVGITLADMKGHPLEVNKAFENMIGYSKEELKKIDFTYFTYPEDISLDLSMFERMKKGKLENYTLEKRYVRKDKKIINVKLYVSLIRDLQTNQPKFTIGIVRDITEDKHVEQELMESEKKYKQLFEKLNDAAFLADTETGYILDTNKQAELLLGYKRNEIIGMHQSQLHPPEKKIEAINVFKQHVESQGENFDFEILNKKGEVIPVNISAAILNINNKKIILGIFRDITERKQLDKRKDEFISMASHELKTPITTIKAFNQILLKEIESNNYRNLKNYLEKMELQIDKLTDLVSDMLDISRIETGKIEFVKSKFDYDNLIKEIISTIQPIFKSHKLFFKGKSDKKIYADRDRISQVLVNFLTNAVKYSPNSNKVIVKIFAHNKEIVTCVKDYGIGISKEDLPWIFNRFYRGKDIKLKTYSGLGIGLYICSEIIKRHNGKIWVTSKKGIGSAFYFSLPLSR